MRPDEISINLKRQHIGTSSGTMMRLGRKGEKAAKETGRVSGEDGRKPRDRTIPEVKSRMCFKKEATSHPANCFNEQIYNLLFNLRIF